MFIKLFTQILDSSIADDRKLRHFFTDLLLCADSKGIVMMTKAALARRIGCDVQEVEWGIRELQRPDPQSKTPDQDGRRIEAMEGSGYGWRILNYEHYRAMKDADQLRESANERVKRFRAKKKLQVIDDGNASEMTRNGGNANTEADSEADTDTKSKKSTTVRFTPPTSQEVEAYASSIEFKVDGQYFCDSYQKQGWRTKAGAKITDWKAAVRTWKKNQGFGNSKVVPQSSINIPLSDRLK